MGQANIDCSTLVISACSGTELMPPHHHKQETNMDIVATFVAVIRKQRFVICKYKYGRKHSTYGIVKVNKDRSVSKRQIVELAQEYQTAGQAKLALKIWDLT